VLNILGKEVTTLVNGEINAGSYNAIFDASNLSSGIYFYSLTGNNVNITKKMILMK
ncbi:MAG: peptidase S8, partial [Gammaproteobacteria bacterium]